MCLAGLLHLHCFSRVHLCPSFTGHVIVPLHYVTSPHSFASSSVFCFVAVYCFFIFVPVVLHLLLYLVPSSSLASLFSSFFIFVPVVLHLLLYLVPSSFLFPRFFTFSLLPSSTQGVIMWLFTLVERLHSCFVLLSCISFFFRLFGVWLRGFLLLVDFAIFFSGCSPLFFSFFCRMLAFMFCGSFLYPFISSV